MAYIGKQPAAVALASSDITDGIVSTAKIADTAITNAKLNADIISADTALASEPANTDEFLVSDAGTLKRIDYSLLKSNTPYFFATINTSQSVANTTETTLQYTVEVFDSGSSYNTGTYKWIPQTAGKYLIFHQWSVNTSTDCYAFNAVTKNGTQFARFNGRNFDTDSYYCQGITSLDGDTDYVTATGYHEQGGSLSNASNTKVSYFGGLLLSTT